MIAPLLLLGIASMPVLRLDVSVSEYGLRGTGTIVVDRLDGRFARRFNVGPASDGDGFDGRTSWMSDSSGAAYPQGNADTRSRIATWSRVLRRFGTASSPRNFCMRVGEAQECVTFRGVRRLAGGLVPFEITVRDQQGTRTIHVRRVESLRTVSPAIFALPALPHDFGMLRHFQIAEVPMLRERLGNRTLPLVVVPARINGGRIMRFLVDTGGQNILTRAAAEELHLRTSGSINIGGAGTGTVPAAFAEVDSFTIGNAYLRQQPFWILPLGDLPDIDGVIGAEVFSRFAARIDYTNDRLQFAINCPLAWLRSETTSAIAFDKNMPDIDGEVDGIPGRFTLDTGSVGGLDLNAPFVRLHHFEGRYAAVSGKSRIVGIGGAVQARRVQLTRVKLGSAVMRFVPGRFTSPGGGVTDDPTIAGNVGEQILRRYRTVTFDYRQRRMSVLLPSAGHLMSP